MNFYQLEVFCTVAKVSSFTRAARLLHLTQPAVSAQVKGLEAALGVQLFNRHGRGVSLTHAGELVYDYARKILALASTMEREIAETISDTGGHLRIAATEIVGRYILPCTVWTFRRSHPSTKIHIQIASKELVLRLLDEGAADVAVLEGEVPAEGRQVQSMGREQVVLITPPSRKWRDKKEVDLEELLEENIVVSLQDTTMRSLWGEALKAAGVDEGRVSIVEVGGEEGLKSAVMAGLGVALVLKITALKEIHEGTLHSVKVRRLPASLPLHAVYRPDAAPGITRRFVSMVCNTPIDCANG